MSLSFEQKIEILSKQALDYCNENGLKFKQYNQKFAQLIAQECAEIARDTGTDTVPEDFALDKCYEIEAKIKQNFGVKE